MMDISNLVGMSGEEQLEQIQEEMYEELYDLTMDFLKDIKHLAKRDGYDLNDDAMTYVKNLL